MPAIKTAFVKTCLLAASKGTALHWSSSNFLSSSFTEMLNIIATQSNIMPEKTPQFGNKSILLLVTAFSCEIEDALLPLTRRNSCKFKINAVHLLQTSQKLKCYTSCEMRYISSPHCLTLWVPERNFSNHWTLNQAFLVPLGPEWTFD